MYAHLWFSPKRLALPKSGWYFKSDSTVDGEVVDWDVVNVWVVVIVVEVVGVLLVKFVSGVVIIVDVVVESVVEFVDDVLFSDATKRIS